MLQLFSSTCSASTRAQGCRVGCRGQRTRHEPLVPQPQKCGCLALQVQQQLEGGAPLLSLRICSSKLDKLPASLGRLSSLQTLDLEGCTSLQLLPVSLGQLASLHTLNLEGCTQLLPSESQLSSLRIPSNPGARHAAEQLWAAIRSEHKQQSIIDAGGAATLVGALAHEGAADPLRAIICNILRVLARNNQHCSRLAEADAGPALLRLFCRDDFYGCGMPQQRAAPGMALLEMMASEVSSAGLPASCVPGARLKIFLSLSAKPHLNRLAHVAYVASLPVMCSARLACWFTASCEGTLWTHPTTNNKHNCCF